jgi:hypothetical protein
MNKRVLCIAMLLTFSLVPACNTREVGVKDRPTATEMIPSPVPTLTLFAFPTNVPSSVPSSTPLPPTATATPERTVTPVPSTATPTPVPPTATALPPTSTSTPAPAAERILFAPGATQATVQGYLPANTTQRYVMHVVAGQYVELDATVGTTGGGLRFSVVGADGALVKPMGDAHIRIVVPSTQDYFVELASDVGAVNYQMSVLIPVRVRFDPGAISDEVDGSPAAGDVRHYVLHAQAGQRMIVAPTTTQGQVRLVIWGADGQVFLSGRVGPPGGVFDGILPVTQDYLVAAWAEGETSADYVLEITIN